MKYQSGVGEYDLPPYRRKAPGGEIARDGSPKFGAISEGSGFRLGTNRVCGNSGVGRSIACVTESWNCEGEDGRQQRRQPKQDRGM